MENETDLFWTRFWKSEEGNVFPVMALGTIVLAALIGGGVDMSRAYLTQNRLQNACDAGVLAGRRSVTSNGFDNTAKTAAEEYFNVNFANVADVSKTSFVPAPADSGNTVMGTASTELSLTVMKMLGFESMAIAVDCTASMSMGNADVVMVLDVTGSMGSKISATDSTKRIDALKSAMKNFYSSVNGSVGDTNARVRYGFVPYSQTVNVGYLLTNEDFDWIADETKIQSREPKFKNDDDDDDDDDDGDGYSYKEPKYSTETSIENYEVQAWSQHSGGWGNSNACRRKQPEDSSWGRNGATTTTTNTYFNDDGDRITETRTVTPGKRTVYECYRESNGRYYVRTRAETVDYHYIEIWTEERIDDDDDDDEKVFKNWEYKEIKYDTSQYKLGATVTTQTGENGTNQNSTWAGCIEERETKASDSISYNSITGFSPSKLYDLDIDSEPDNDKTRWKPYWPEVTYVRTTENPNELSDKNKSDYGKYVGRSCPREAQLLSTMSQGQFDSYTNSLSPSGSTYHDIGMIWGARLISKTGLFAANVNAPPANNNKVSQHVIFMTDGEMSTTRSGKTAWGVEWHDRRVTDDGYTDQNQRHGDRLAAMCEAVKARGVRIWVIAFSTSLTAQLNDCASPNSAFTADSASSLNTTFQEIARNVGDLQIIQ